MGAEIDVAGGGPRMNDLRAVVMYIFIGINLIIMQSLKWIKLIMIIHQNGARYRVDIRRASHGNIHF